METRITDCDIVRGNRNNFVYATFEGVEIRVLGKLPKSIYGDMDRFIGLTESQAKELLDTINQRYELISKSVSKQKTETK